MANDAAACLSINLLLDTIEAMAITSFSSVNGKVTVPVGGSVATALLPTWACPSPLTRREVLLPVVSALCLSAEPRSGARPYRSFCYVFYTATVRCSMVPAAEWSSTEASLSQSVMLN